MHKTALIFFGLLGLGMAAYIVGDSLKGGSDLSLQWNATYEIEGVPVTLQDGYAERQIASGPKIVTRYFGNEASGDLNGDGADDLAFLLTQEIGGRTFYYAAVALRSSEAYTGTNAMLLGENIEPQSTEIQGSEIIVNYGVDEGGQSANRSSYFTFENGVLTGTPGELIEARIDEGGSALGMKVVPLEVLEDSRCPADVQCIQAGTVRVRAQVMSEDAPAETLEFTLGTALSAQGAQITLTEVLPGAKEGAQIKPGQYQFVFTVRA